MKSLLKEFAFPVLWELLFIALYIMRPFKTLYLFFVFYLVLFVYFREYFSLKEFSSSFKKIKEFWIPVVITAVAAFAANWIKVHLIQMKFIGLDGTYIITWENSYIGEAMYAITIMLLGPIVSELFYRKAVMRFSSPACTAVSFVLGLVLCCFSSAYLPLGLAEAAVLALPYAISYLLTRNIYIPITVHILFMMYQHIPNVVYDIARISLR